ncbi:Bromodomain-containing protein, partial [Amylostereum chailletii]
MHDATPSSDYHDDISSPPIDSPATPVNTSEHPDVKIPILSADPDAISSPDPVPIKLVNIDDASTRPRLSSPLHPGTFSASFHPSPSLTPALLVTIPIVSPHATPPPSTGDSSQDVQMAEESADSAEAKQEDVDVEMKEEQVQPAQPLTNGHAHDEYPATHSPVPPPLPEASSATLLESHPPIEPITNGDDHAQPPPSKRARKFSDADRASSHAITAAPSTHSVSVDVSSRSATLSIAQHKFATSTVRTLKKLKDANPFKAPVDPIALNIPHYFQVIKSPMDLSTVEKKLTASNPARPDTNPLAPRYLTAEDFISDVRLIFSNSVTFNGPEHPVTQMGKRVEAVFDKQIKQLPAPEEPKPAPVKKVLTPPPPPPPAPAPAPVAKKAPAPRRPSTSVPVIRRNDTLNPGRPKREIHPPPPKDLPYADAPKKQRRRTAKRDGSDEQLKYCGKILDQLGRKQHQYTVQPFAEPVDWQRLGIPDYPKIIKKPMDLLTMRQKLDNGDYASAEKFRQDFALIIKNCFEYNSPGTPVNQAGIELQHLFEDKWKGLPSLRTVESEDDDEDVEESDDERARAIAAMEQQMANMRDNIEALKSKAVKKEKKPKKKRPSETISAPIPSSSKPKKEPKSAPPPKKKGNSKKAVIPDDDALSFEQKKDLSEAIQNLDGPKLEKVIGIIHEGVPEIRDVS